MEDHKKEGLKDLEINYPYFEWLVTFKSVDAKMLCGQLWRVLRPIETYFSYEFKELDKVPQIHNSLKTKDWGFTSIFLETMRRIQQMERAAIFENPDVELPSIDEITQTIRKLVGLFEDITRTEKHSRKFEKNSLLPYSIQDISIYSFLNLSDIFISSPFADTQFIVLTGFNGEGKSSFLQAISIALTEGRSENENTDFVMVEYTHNANTLPRKKYISSVSRTKLHRSIGTPIEIYPQSLLPFAAYGASRLQLMGAYSQAEERNYQSPHYSLFHDDGKLLNIGTWLSRPSKQKYIAAVTEVLGKLLPSAKANYDAENQDFIYTENGNTVKSYQLSAGNKSILAMVGDMIIRLWEKQPQVDKVEDLAGIVLIDELETHLHPRWQREIARILSETFPQVQFIVTTHSPIVLLGMPADKTMLFNISTQEEKTVVAPVEMDLANELPHALLRSPLFGMDNLRHDNSEGIARLNVEEDWQKRQERDAIEKKLLDFSKTFRFTPPKDDKN